MKRDRRLGVCPPGAVSIAWVSFACSAVAGACNPGGGGANGQPDAHTGASPIDGSVDAPAGDGTLDGDAGSVGDGGVVGDGGADGDATVGDGAGDAPGDSTRADADAGPAPPPDGSGGPIPVTNAVCSIDGWCWVSPLPTNCGLYAAWGTSATDMWFAGDCGTRAHWDGAQWKGATSAGVYANLSGSATNDVWAIGPDVSHYDGSSWTSVSAPTGLRAGWARAADDAWAVGDVGTIAHWNGTAWSPVPSGTLFDLKAVFGFAANDVWAGGAGAPVLHYDGTRWSAALPWGADSGPTMTTLWGSSPSDLWMGPSGFHWDGGAWNVFEPSNGYVICQGDIVAGANRNDVLFLRSPQNVGDRYLGWWNGTGCTYGPGYVAAPWRTVWGVPSGDFFLAGGDAQLGPGVVYQSTGSNATQISTPLDSNLSGGGWWAPAQGELWTVNANRNSLNHWDGAHWTTYGSGSNQTLTGMWGRSPNDIWAFGQKGIVSHWDGTAWTASYVGAQINLIAGWASGPSDAWFSDGTSLVRGSPGSWTVQPNNGGGLIMGSSLNDVWVAASSNANHWNGSSWTTYSNPLGNNNLSLKSFFVRAASDAFVVDDQGDVAHWDGTAWSRIANGPPTRCCSALLWTSATDLWGVDYTNAFTNPPVYHFDGAGWTTTASGASGPLDLIAGTGPHDLWVGGGGATLRRR
jgi:hypothetical protein